MRAGMFGLEDHSTGPPDSVAHGVKLSGNNAACLGDGDRPAEGESSHHCYPRSPTATTPASGEIDIGDVISPSTVDEEPAIRIVLAHIDGDGERHGDDAGRYRSGYA